MYKGVGTMKCKTYVTRRKKLAKELRVMIVHRALTNKQIARIRATLHGLDNHLLNGDVND